MFTYEEKARIVYAEDNEKTRDKAIAAGISMDNSLKSGRFRAEQWLKYFDCEKWGQKRMQLYYEALRVRLSDEK